MSDPAQVKVGSVLLIPPPPESNRFVWPARGAQSSSTGGGEAGRRGLEIKAPEGSIVRASRTGRVAVATQQLTGFGKTVVLDHGDGYVTLYARLDQLLVSPGAAVKQGDPIGRLGEAPLYFEIRYGVHVRNPLQLLP
ncbi:MAG: peptidoglycan DD-metalloendopeptidase family protein [Candidatus Omnitrophica bacterium]|nr:peptidoglycan DD-metalloendopeptidase family protein [Candidatus Omnitrophota bacterium]